MIEMPEGWQSLRKILDRDSTRKDGVMIVNAMPLIATLDLMKEMAETLESYEKGIQDIQAATNEFCSATNISPPKFDDLLNCSVLEKFKEWK